MVTLNEHVTADREKFLQLLNGDWAVRTVPISSFTNYKPIVGLFNETLVAEPSDDISVIFDYGVLENRPHGTVITTTGDGSVTDTSGVGLLASTTGTSKMCTRDRISYKPGHTVMAKFTVSFSGAGTGLAGLFDDDDGFFLKYVGGTLSVVRRREGSDTEATTLNGVDISSIDWTKIQICYILFGFLGVGNISFFVLDTNGTPLNIHTFETIGNLTTTHIRHPILPFQFETSGDMQIKIGSIQGMNFGNSASVNKQNFGGDHNVSVSASSTGVLANYLCKTTFEYKVGSTTSNKKKARLIQAQFNISPPSSGSGYVKFTISQTVSVASASWSDVDQYNSIMEVDTAGTPTIQKVVLTKYANYSSGSGGQVDFGGDIGFEADRLGLVGYAGDIFSIRAENVGSGTVSCQCSINWEEI